MSSPVSARLAASSSLVRRRHVAAVLAALAALPASGVTFTYFDTQVASGALNTTLADPYALHLATGFATQSGQITGDGGITKIGAGTLTLSANNVYTGVTTVDAGTLRLTGTAYSQGAGSGSVIVNSGGTLALHRSDIFGNHLSSSPVALTINAGGLVTNNGVASFNTLNNLTLNGGTLEAGSGVEASWPAYQLKGTVTAGGASASAITSTGGTNSQIQLGNNAAGGTTTFAVADATASNAEDLSITAVLQNGRDAAFAAVASGLVKTGAGTLGLHAANTFSGNLTLNDGTLGIGNNQALGSGTVVINGGIIRAVNAARTVANPLQLNGSFTVGRLTTFTGATTLGADVTITANNHDGPANGDSTFNGVISGVGRSVTIAQGPQGLGTGAVVFGGANTYTGSTTVQSGRLVQTSSSASTAYQIDSGAVLELNTASGNRDLPTATFTGSGTLRKTGANEVRWSGGSATFALGSGSLIDVQAGTFVGGSNANENWSANLSDLHVASGAVFNGVEANVRVDALTGSGTIRSGYDTAFGYQNFTFGVDGGSGVFSGTLSNNGFVGNYVKAGSGTQTLSGDNTYTGTTTLAGGTLALGSTGALGTTGLIGFTGGALQFSAYNTTDYSARFDTAAGQLYRLDTNGQNVALASPLTSSGGSLTKLGDGTLTLSGANTYDGGTTLAGGTLALGSSDAVGSSGALSFTGGTLRFSAANTADYSARFSTAAGQLYRLDTNGHDVALASLLSSSGGSLAKLGAGTLTLSGANTFNGGITVSDGILEATTSASALGAGSVALAGGDLVLTSDVGLAFNRPLAISADATVTANRLTNGASSFTHNFGALTIGAHTLENVRGANFTSGAYTLTFTGSTLAGDATFAPGLNTQISLGNVGQTGGPRSLTVDGPGAVNIGTGSNYTGITTIKGGALLAVIFGNAGMGSSLGASSPAASNLVLDGGMLRSTNTSVTDRLFTLGANGGSSLDASSALSFTNSGAIAFSGGPVNRTLTLSGGNTGLFAPALGDDGAGITSILKTGPGSWVLSGANTYTGSTSVTGGTLGLAGAATLASTNLSLSGGGVLATSGSFTPALGTGPGQVQFGTGGGGFAAYGAPLTVTTFASTPVWGSGGVLADGTSLQLGSSIATHAVTLPSAIDLGAGVTRTINVNDNAATADDVAIVSGVISGANGAISKTGAGTLVLTAPNTYTGTTGVNGGTLAVTGDGAISAANLAMSGGGVFATSDVFSRPVGNGTGQFSLNGFGGGGFAAYGGPLTVTGLSGTWGTTAGFLVGGGPLVLGSVNATDPVTLASAFSLGSGATRTITVNDNAFSTADHAVISGVISSGANGGLTKNGTGTLVLSGANTYTGVTTVSFGVLSIDTLPSVGAGPGSLGAPTTVAEGTIALTGTLRYTGAGDLTDRVISIPSTAAASLEASGTGALVFTSDLSVTGGNTKSFTLGGTSTAANEFRGAIVNNSAVNLTHLVKSGPGSWIVSGANTHTGTTTVNEGTLLLGSSSALANNTLTVQSSTAGGLSVLDLNGFDSTVTNLVLGGSASSNPTSSSLLRATGGGTLTLSSSSGGITFNTSGNPLGSEISADLLLSGGGVRNFNVNDSTTAAIDLVISGSIAESGVVSITKTGGGTLLLSGANTHSGGTTLSAGALAVGHDSALGTGTFTFSGGTLQGDGAPRTLANPVTLNTTAPFFGGAGDLTLTGLLTNNTNSNPSLTFTNTGATTLGPINLANSTTNRTVTLHAPAGLVTVGGVIANGGGSTGSALTKSGSGTLVLGAINTYGGATNVNDGTLRLGVDNSLPSTTTLSLAAPAAAAPVLVDLNGRTSTVASLTVASGPLSASQVVDASGGGLLRLGGGVTYNSHSTGIVGSEISAALDLGSGATRTFTVNDSPFASVDLRVSGVIGDTTASGLTKTGPGTLALSGANTYRGATSVTGGVLSITSLPSVGAGSGSLGAPATVADGTIALNGGTLRYTGAGQTTDRVVNLSGTNSSALDASGTGPLVFTSAFTATGTGTKSLTLTGDSTAANTLQGAIVNNSAGNTTGVVKSGPGTWILAGANTYTGNTAVAEGILALGASGTLSGASSLVVAPILPGVTATFDLNGFNASTPGLTLGGASPSAAGSYSRVLATGGGTLSLGSGGLFYANAGNPLGALVEADLDLGGATRTFNIADSTNAAVDVSITGDISSPTAGVGLTKSGAGTLLLSGANAYAGPTLVNHGTLALGSSTALPNTAVTLLSNVTPGLATLDLNGHDLAVQSLTLGGSGASSTGATQVLASGGGTLRLGGDITYNATNNPLGSTIAAGIGLGSGVTRTFNIADSTGAEIELTVSGPIGQTATSGLTKSSSGTLLLTAAQTYTGVTTVTGGALALSDPGFLANSNLVLNGGVLALGGASTPALGFGPGQVLFGSSGGGFAAYGAPLTVTTFDSTPVWGTGGAMLNGSVFILGSASSGHATIVPSAIHLGTGVSQTIAAIDNIASAADLAIVSGVISGTGSNFTKSGTGTLVLTATNTYTGQTTITSGTLALSDAGTVSAANLHINGGVFATNDTLGFNRPLGNGAGQVQLGGNGGGFAAYGGPLTLTSFTGNPVWGSTPGFFAPTGNLILGSVNATDLVTWTNDFSLGAATRTITVNDNLFTTADSAEISGVISGAAGSGLVKTGTGLLTLSGLNTYTGPTTLSAGVLSIASLPSYGNAGPLGAAPDASQGTIHLNGGTLRYTGAGNTTDRVLNLLGSGTIESSGTGPLVFTSALTGTTGGSKTLFLGGTSTAANQIQGAIVNGSGTTTLVKSGPGTWLISGANTYTGGTAILDGTLRLGSSASLSNSTLSVTSNTAGGTATLDLNGYDATVPGLTLGDVAGSSSASSSRITATGGGTLTLGGNLAFNSVNNPLGSTIAANLNLGSGARVFTVADSSNALVDLAVSGAIGQTAASSLAKAGSGALLLSGANTYSGGTTLSAGTLIAGHDSAFGTGAVSLSSGTLQGDGTPRTLANAIGVNSLSSATIGGTSDLAFTGVVSNTLVGNTVTLNISNQGTTTFGAVNLGTNTSGRGLTFNTTGGLVTLAGPVANGPGSGANGLTKTGSGTLELAAANTYTGATTVLDGTLRLGAAGTISGSLGITASGPGATAVFDLNGGDITLPGVTLGGAVGATSTSSAHLVATGGGTVTLTNNIVYQTTGNPLGSAISADLNFGTGSRAFTVADSSSAAVDLTVSGDISENVANSNLIKNGAGTLLLSGVNTYSGATTVNDGTVILGSSAALPATTVNLFATASGGTAMLDLGGHDISAPGLAFGGSFATSSSHLAATGGGTVTLLGAGGVVYFNTNQPLGSTVSANLNLGTLTRTFNIADSTNAASDLTVSGDISATSASTGILKVGAGALLLSGVNTYSGPTTVNDGTLRLGSSTALPAATALTLASSITNGLAVLDLNGQHATAASLTFGGVNLGGLTNSAAHLTSTGGGSLTLSGALTYSPVGSPLGSVVSADLRLAGASSQLFHIGDSSSASTDLTISGSIVDATTGSGSGFTKTGAGTLLLSGSNSSYTGATFIQEGTVRLGATGALSAGSALGLANSRSAFLDLNSHDQTIGGLSGGGASGGNIFLGGGNLTVRGGGTYSGLISGTGGLAKEGLATLSLPTAHVYIGGTALRAGTLALGHDGSLGSGPITATGGSFAPLGAFRTLANDLNLDGTLGLVSTGANHAFTFTGPVTLDGDSTFAATQDSGSLDVVHTVSGVIAGPHALTVSRQGSASLGAAGGFVLSAANTFSGGLSIDGTRLFVSADNQLGDANGGLTLRNGGILQTSVPLVTTRLLTVEAGGGVLDHGANALAFTGISGSGDLLKSGPASLTLTGSSTYNGILTSTTDLALASGSSFRFGPQGTTNTGIVNDGVLVFDSASSRSYDQIVSGSGSVEIEGTPSSVFSLGGLNTYAGDTTLRSGTLAFSALSNFGSTGDLVFAGGTLRWATGNTSDPSARFAALGSSDAAFDPNGQAVTLGTALTGNSGLILAGSGTLTLGAANTYAGNTTVRSGTLRLGTASALPATDVNLLSSVTGGTATLDLNGYDASVSALTLGGATATSASRVLATGGGTLAVDGTITFDATHAPLGASIAANLDLGSGATRTFAIGDSANAAVDLAITGSLGETANSGSILVKTGAGTLSIDTAATYSGYTQIQQGTLRLGVAQALPSSNAILIDDASGARLDLAGHDQTFASISGGGSTGGEIALGSATLTLGSGLFDGVVSGSGSLVKTGLGSLILNGANTYSGGTTLGGGGALLLGHDSALGSGPLAITDGALFAYGASRTLDNALSLDGNLTLVGNPSNAVFTFTGPVSLQRNLTLTASQAAGSVDAPHTFSGDIDGARSLTLTRSGAATLGSNGGFVLSGTNTFSGGLIVDATRVSVSSDSSLGASTSGVTLRNGAILRTSAALDTDRLLTVGTGGATLDHGANALTFTGLSGSGNLLKSGAGSLTLTGTSTFNGTLTSSTALELGTNASFRFGPQGTTNAGILNDGTLAFDSTSARTFSPSISGSGSVEIEGTSAGVLTLGGLNTYTGDTTLRGGTLVFSSPDNLGSGSIAFAGGALRWATGNTADISSRLAPITSAGGTAHLNGQALAFATGITGSGGLALTGGGSLALTGDNTFAGSLGIGAGTTVHLGNGGTTGSLTGPVLNQGSLVVDRSNDSSYQGVLSGNGLFTKNGAGSLTLGGDNSAFSGASSLNAGTVALAHNNALGTGAATLNGASLQSSGGPRVVATPMRLNADTVFGGSQPITFTGAFTLLRNRDLVVENTALTTLSGSIGQSGGGRGLNKYGAGELQLTGANTYSGGTYIGEGVVRINNTSGSAFGSGAVTVESGATLTGAGTFTGALQLNVGATFSPGNSPGLTTIGSGSVLEGTTLFELGGTVRSTSASFGAGHYDAINVGGAGALTVGGDLDVVFFGGFTPTGSVSFQLFQATSIGGTFAAINLPSLASGYSWDTTQLYSDGILGLNAIPEPAAYATLAALGALALAATRRRRRTS